MTFQREAVCHKSCSQCLHELTTAHFLLQSTGPVPEPSSRCARVSGVIERQHKGSHLYIWMLYAATPLCLTVIIMTMNLIHSRRHDLTQSSQLQFGLTWSVYNSTRRHKLDLTKESSLPPPLFILHPFISLLPGGRPRSCWPTVLGSRVWKNKRRSAEQKSVSVSAAAS